jgi:hypothetical protein
MLVGFVQLFSLNVFSADLTIYKEYDSQFSQASFPSKSSSLCPSVGVVPECFASGPFIESSPGSDPLDEGFFMSLNSFNETLTDSYQKRLDAYQNALRKQYLNQVSALKNVKKSFIEKQSSVAINAGITNNEYADKLKQDKYLKSLNDMLVVENVDSFLQIEESDSQYKVVTSNTLTSSFHLNHACKINKFSKKVSSIRRNFTYNDKRTNQIILQTQRRNISNKEYLKKKYYNPTNVGVSTRYILINDSLSIASMNSINVQIMKDWINRDAFNDFISNRRDVVSQNLLSGASTDELQVIAINHNNGLELLNSELTTLEKIELNLLALLARKVVKNTSFNTIR